MKGNTAGKWGRKGALGSKWCPGGGWPRQKEQKAKAEARSPGKCTRSASSNQTKYCKTGKCEKAWKLLHATFYQLGGWPRNCFLHSHNTPKFLCHRQTVDLLNKTSEDLSSGLSSAKEDKRTVSLCDQGHEIHISAKVCNALTLSLPSLPTPVTHEGGDNHELTEPRLTASMELSWVLLEHCNPLFWTYQNWSMYNQFKN